MAYIVLDTNIWIGRCLGVSAQSQVVSQCRDDFTFAFSKETIAELKCILEAITYPSQQEAKAEVLNSIDEGMKFTVADRITGVLLDESDHRFLELAAVAKADFLVTQNTKDFGHLESFEATQIVTAEEFLVRSKEQEFEEIRKARIEKGKSRLAELKRQQNQQEREL